MATVWTKLREYRLSLGLSQTEFAKLYLGSDDRNSQMIIYRLEKGLVKKFPSEFLSKISIEIGTTVDNICNENLESIFDKPVRTDFTTIDPLLNKVLDMVSELQLVVNKLRKEIDHLKRQ